MILFALLALAAAATSGGPATTATRSTATTATRSASRPSYRLSLNLQGKPVADDAAAAGVVAETRGMAERAGWSTRRAAWSHIASGYRLEFIFEGPSPPLQSPQAAAGVLAELVGLARAAGWLVTLQRIEPIQVIRA